VSADDVEVALRVAAEVVEAGGGADGTLDER
jgi:hypothetical protein